MNDETRTYDCCGMPVELTLPEGKHYNVSSYGFFSKRSDGLYDLISVHQNIYKEI